MAKDFKEVIKFAIGQEKEAIDFYTDLQKKVNTDASKKILQDFIDMERGHITMLTSFDKENAESFVAPKVTDLKISDYMIDYDPNEKVGFQEILTIAAKKEEAAKQLYEKLAAETDDEKVKNVFLKIGAEEAKHKLQLETLFDDEIFAEN